MTDLKDRAQGHWPDILAAAGVPAHLLNTSKHQACPFCGGKDRFRFTDRDGKGLFWCQPCGGSIGPIDFLMKLFGWDYPTAAGAIERQIGATPYVVRKRNADEPGNLQDKLDQLWTRGSEVLSGDPVDLYLSARGVGLQVYPLTLKYVQRLYYRNEDEPQGFFPALLAALQDPAGTPVNIHRTYLTLDGRKANVDEPRKMMPAPIPEGSAIRLAPVTNLLGVSEGLETALAASKLFNMPVWSAVSADGLEKWTPPPGVDQVIIFGDNDASNRGQAAANVLAHRLYCRGIGFSIRIPETTNSDWNDELLKVRKAA